MSGASPCSSCRKRCCTNYTVSIIGYDAWVIGKGLCLPLGAFLVHFPAASDNERAFLLEPGGPRFEIALDKVGSYQKGNPCVFWVELLDGGGRCGIYPYRPLVCQTYPAYQQEEMVALRHDVLCPEGAWNLVGMDLPIFRQRLSRFRLEQDIYAYIVSGWNRRVEQEQRLFRVEAFYTVLMNLYEPLQQWLAAQPREIFAEVVRQWGELPPSRPNPLLVNLRAAGEDAPWQAAIQGIRACLQSLAPWLGENELIDLAA